MSIECQICYDSISGVKTISYGCEHRFCSECVRKCLETEINEGKTDQLVCPSCDQKANKTLIKSLVSREVFAEYVNLVLRKELEANHHWINCPNCIGGSILVRDSISRAYCDRCHMRYCTNCMTNITSDVIVGHQCGPTHTQIGRDERLSHDFMVNKCKRCSVCRAPIMKIGGCNQMKCRCGSLMEWYDMKWFD